MALVGDYTRRTFGPFYWLPVPLGVLSILYGGASFETYWETKTPGMLSMGLWAVSCGVTLISVESRSYVVASLDVLIALVNIVIVVIYGDPIFLYLSFTSLIFAGGAIVPRQRRSKLKPDIPARA